MADHWQDSATAIAVVRDDDDEAPDDWEAELEEKPKPAPEVEEKPKAPASTKNKASKKKYDAEDSTKVIQQSEGNFTPEQLDEIEQKEELQKTKAELDDVTGLVDTDGVRQSLDNIILVSRDEFLNYSLRLANHLELVSKSEFYPDFMEHFLHGITEPLSTDGVKRLSTTLQTILLRKQSDERERKAKAKAKKPAKPQLKAVRRSDFGAFGDEDYDQDDDYDDD